MTIDVFKVAIGSSYQSGIASGAPYKRINFGSKIIDTGSYFNTSTSTFTPPAGKVNFGAQVYFVYVDTLQSNGPAWVAKLVKNATFDSSGNQSTGIDIATGLGSLDGLNFTASACIPSVWDVANGTDYYNVMVLASGTGGNPFSIDGNVAHTWWSGSVIY